MFYLEKTISYTKRRYTDDHIFCSFSHIDKVWCNILGHFNNYAWVFLDSEVDNKKYIGNAFEELM